MFLLENPYEPNTIDDVLDRLDGFDGFTAPDHDREFGSWHDYPILGPNWDQRKTGTVYMAGTRIEPILISPIEGPLQEKITTRAINWHRRGLAEEVVSPYLMTLMALDDELTMDDDKRTRFAQDSTEPIVSLSDYLDFGYGVCHQMSALAVAVTEDLVSKGFLKGRPGIDWVAVHSWPTILEPDEEYFGLGPNSSTAITQYYCNQ